MTILGYVWSMWLCGLAYMLAGVAAAFALPAIVLIHIATAIGEASDAVAYKSGRFGDK